MWIWIRLFILIAQILDHRKINCISLFYYFKEVCSERILEIVLEIKTHRNKIHQMDEKRMENFHHYNPNQRHHI